MDFAVVRTLRGFKDKTAVLRNHFPKRFAEDGSWCGSEDNTGQWRTAQENERKLRDRVLPAAKRVPEFVDVGGAAARELAGHADDSDRLVEPRPTRLVVSSIPFRYHTIFSTTDIYSLSDFAYLLHLYLSLQGTADMKFCIAFRLAVAVQLFKAFFDQTAVASHQTEQRTSSRAALSAAFALLTGRWSFRSASLNASRKKV